MRSVHLFRWDWLNRLLIEMARLELGDAYTQESEFAFAMGAEPMFNRSMIDQALFPVIGAVG